MTRSRRKVPIVGMTMAESDKVFKTQEHRRERRAVRQRVDTPTQKKYGNPWASEKDGKQFVQQPSPKLLRK